MRLRVQGGLALTTLLGALLLSPLARPALARLDVTLEELDARLKLIETKTASMSALTDPQTGKATVRFTAVNLQVVNGGGVTHAALNGTGNLIIGYGERWQNAENHREGSHNLILGVANDYKSYGGIVAGNGNSISNAFASVLGGSLNKASGENSVIVGGASNEASAEQATVSGGTQNKAAGRRTSIGGGVNVELGADKENGWKAGS